MRRNGLKAIGLSFLAMLGLMAFMVAGAQATWLENGVETAANKEVIVGTHLSFILEIPVDSLEIECKSLKGTDVLILAKSAKGVGELSFTECETYKGFALQKLCKPIEPINVAGRGELILSGAKNEVLFKPETGLPFARIEFPETCSLPLNNKVNGSLTAECLKASNLEKVDCKQGESVHLFQRDLAGDQLKYGPGEKAANLWGVAKTQLASFISWAGHV